jgi:hypothetical protein
VDLEITWQVLESKRSSVQGNGKEMAGTAEDQTDS